MEGWISHSTSWAKFVVIVIFQNPGNRIRFLIGQTPRAVVSFGIVFFTPAVKQRYRMLDSACSCVGTIAGAGLKLKGCKTIGYVG
jgi:hypothetical protein